MSMLFTFVRTNAPPLPGFTCWNSTMRQTLAVELDVHAVLELVGVDDLGHRRGQSSLTVTTPWERRQHLGAAVA